MPKIKAAQELDSYKSISEASKIINVPAHVLRFWEKEFQYTKIHKENGRRYYLKKDIDFFSKVKELLYNQGYTIEGAKVSLEGNNKLNIKSIINDLIRIKELIRNEQ